MNEIIESRGTKKQRVGWFYDLMAGEAFSVCYRMACNQKLQLCVGTGGRKR